MNLFPFLNSVQASTTLDDTWEGETVREKVVVKHLVKEKKGFVGTVVLDVAIDDHVP